MPKIMKLHQNLSKLCPEMLWLLFSGHCVLCTYLLWCTLAYPNTIQCTMKLKLTKYSLTMIQDNNYQNVSYLQQFTTNVYSVQIKALHTISTFSSSLAVLLLVCK